MFPPTHDFETRDPAEDVFIEYFEFEEDNISFNDSSKLPLYIHIYYWVGLLNISHLISKATSVVFLEPKILSLM